MRRFTKKNPNGRYTTVFDERDADEDSHWVFTTQASIDRLAAYENTGLEPEDISELIENRNVFLDCNGTRIKYDNNVDHMRDRLHGRGQNHSSHWTAESVHRKFTAC